MSKEEFITITAVDKHSSDTMSRSFSTTFKGNENEFILKSMINEWEKDIARINNGVKVPEGFTYSSDNNKEWMTKSQLRAWISFNAKNIAII